MSINSLRRLRLVLITFAFLLATYSSYISPVSAIDDKGCEVYDENNKCQDDFNIANDISVDESVPVCTADGVPLVEGDDGEKEPEIGVVRDYLSRQIITGSQITAIKANRPYYKEAAKKSDIPWQMLAVLHLKAGNLELKNPENGRGVYQLPSTTDVDVTSNKYPAGSISTAKFLTQTKAAAAELKLKAPSLKASSIEDVSTIKRAFYNYYTNSKARSLYVTQSSKLGFSNDYDGSPEVMNKVDEKRDPTKSENDDKWGSYDSDTGKLVYPAYSSYGAYAIFATIAGISLVNCGLSEGGMTLDQAKQFMARYELIDKGDPNNEFHFIVPAFTPYINGGCKNGSKSKIANCVAFSAYFVHKFTKLNASYSVGSKIVSEMSRLNPSMPAVSKTPQVYAIFSTPSGSTLCGNATTGFYICGHTGVVLGIDKSRDDIIIGEAAWCNAGWTAARRYSLAAWTNSSYTYAYTSGFLKEGNFDDL